MKIITLLAIIIAVFYFFKSGHIGNEEIQFNNYHELLAKVKEQPVTIEEIKIGSNMLATFFCNDELYQETGGSTVQRCLKTYHNFKDMCEERIFAEPEKLVSTKDEVIKIAKRYVACVGID